MMEVVLKVRIPDSWINQIRNAPEIPIRILDCMPYGEDGGRGLIQIDAPPEDVKTVVEHIKQHPAICKLDFQPVIKGGTLGSVVLEKCVACKALMNSDCYLISALTTGDGRVEWQLITGADGALRDLLHRLEENGCDVELVKSVRLTRKSQLTDRQEEIMKIAFDQGYYDFPKRITIRTLAGRMEIAPSTLAEILQRGERKIIQQYFKGAR